MKVANKPLESVETYKTNISGTIFKGMQLFNNITILVLKNLHNFNVVDICLTAVQIEGDQGALSHHTSFVHYALGPNTI